MKLRSATAAPKPEPADEEMPLAPPATDSGFDLDPDPDTAQSSDDYVPPGASSAKKRKAKKVGDKQRSPDTAQQLSASKRKTPKSKVDDKERSPETPKQPSASKHKTPRSAKGKNKAVERDAGPFPLLKLPGELIDLILADDDLHLGSHLALAATCKALRTCYYSPRPRSAALSGFHSPVWGALLSARPFTGEGSTYWRKEDVGVELPDEPERIVKHLWTREGRVEVGKMAVVRNKAAVRPYEWDVAVHKVATQRITKTTAKSAYKLNDAELNVLPPQYKRNPHGRSAAPMQLFVEAAVEALAFRLHGGAAGHAELLKKRAASRAKARQTRLAKASGTWVSPTKRRKTLFDSDDDDDSYDESAHEEGDDGAAFSLSPSLSPTLTTQRGQASGSGSGAGPSPSKSVAAALAQLSTASPAKARGASSSSGAVPLALGPAFSLQPAAAQGSFGLAPVKDEGAARSAGSSVPQPQGLKQNPFVGGSTSSSSTSFLLPYAPIPDAQSPLGSPFPPSTAYSSSAAAAVPPWHPHQATPAPHTSSLGSAAAATATASTSTSAPAPLSVSSIPNLTDAERDIVLRLLRGSGDGSSSSAPTAAAATGPAAAPLERGTQLECVPDSCDERDDDGGAVGPERALGARGGE